MSASTSPRQTSSRASHLVAGVLGGLIVLGVGAVLLATDVVDTGNTTREVVRQQPIERPSPEEADGGRTVSDIYKKEGEGVVFVQARGAQSEDSPLGIPQEGTATGSGFVVDDEGYIVTNSHVVQDADEVEVRFEEDGEGVPAEVKGRDPSSDLAVLKVDPDKAELRPLPLGDSKTAHVGDPVVAIGNPFGFTRTVTTGIVSALQREIRAPNGFTIEDVIQTDASINPGNSGGPLLDAEGKVIGINSQIATGGSGAGSVSIGFAVPVNTAKKLLPNLRKGEQVKRPFLGITTTKIDKRLAQELNLPTDKGALVVEVREGSPADKACLRAGRITTTDNLRLGGDLIFEVAGKKVEDPDDVLAAIEGKKPGDDVVIRYYRGGDKKTARLELGNRPAADAAAPEQQQPDPLIP